MESQAFQEENLKQQSWKTSGYLEKAKIKREEEENFKGFYIERKSRKVFSEEKTVWNVILFFFSKEQQRTPSQWRKWLQNHFLCVLIAYIANNGDIISFPKSQVNRKTD